MRVDALRAILIQRKPDNSSGTDLSCEESNTDRTAGANKPTSFTRGILGAAIFSFLGSSAFAIASVPDGIQDNVGRALERPINYGLSVLCMVAGAATCGSVFGSGTDEEVSLQLP